MCFFGGSGSDSHAGDQAEQQNLALQGQINNGYNAVQKAFSQFTPQFYGQQQQDYINEQQPQIDRQWANAQQNLGYALDRSGLTYSTAAAKAESDAQYTDDQAEQTLADNAAGYVNTLKSNVANTEGSLDNELTQGANVGQVAQQASDQAGLLNTHAPYSALGNLFQGVTSDLSSYAQGYTYQNGASPFTGLIPGQAGYGVGSGSGAQIYGGGNTGQVVQ
jgi:hypothetical protein